MVRPDFLQRFSRAGIRRIRSVYRRLAGYPVVRNALAGDEKQSATRALLIYLTEPFLLQPNDPRFRQHQNLRQNMLIARILGEFGYIVDVRDISDRRAYALSEYQLVISHRVDLNVPPDRFRERSILVYLATGIHHVQHNSNIRARYAKLESRRRCKIPPVTLNTEFMPFLERADFIVGIGNSLTTGTWKEGSRAPILPVNNFALQVEGLENRARNFEMARKNFFFFASRDQIAKGLDLLLEIFPRHPDLQLYICSRFSNEREFVRCYSKELFRTPNVHAIGLLDIADPALREILQKCAFVILPSCSEGQPGSVLQCMQEGLIPLITRACGIDPGSAGRIFDDDSVETIEKTIMEAAGNEPSALARQSSECRILVTERYSETAFIRRWREIAAGLQTAISRGPER
jgi:glycosyltransferase involved in cell wall biosynthesis